MGRGGYDSSSILYGPTRRAPKPSSERLDRTLLQISSALRSAEFWDGEFWDGTISPHDLLIKYGRITETEEQRRASVANWVRDFDALASNGFLELAEALEDERHAHRYRLTELGKSRGVSLEEIERRRYTEEIERRQEGSD